MTLISDMREGMIEVLASVQDSDGAPELYPYAENNPAVPSIRILYPDEVSYDDPAMGNDSYTFVLQALIGLIEDTSAQMTLDSMISRAGARSVKSAIETKDANGDATLGGRVDQAIVRGCTGYREYIVGGATVLGAEWEVQVDITT